MRLAITHPYSWPEVRRGAERIVVETARALAGRGHHVTVLTAGANPGRSRSDGVLTIRLRRVFANPSHHERYFGWRILPYLASGRFDAVHAMMPADALAGVRARRLGRYRLLYDEMGIPWRWWWSQQPDRKTRERLVRAVDVYGCMSPFTLEVLRNEWGREGALIPGGVRLAQFAPADEREPVPTILFSGAMSEPRKGLAELLEAVSILATDEPKLRLWLSGPGDPEPIIAAAPTSVRDCIEVLPLGTPEEQGTRYARAWVTVLPSISDSFGLVLIESLASGTPIVVLDDCAPPSLVTPETGAVAEPHNPASLAVALGRGLALAADPDTATRCREFSRHYDWDEAIAPLLERLYSGAP